MTFAGNHPPEPGKPLVEAKMADKYPAVVDPTLVTILSWKRPHQSRPEIAFCEWLFDEIKNRGGAPSRMAEDCIVCIVPGVTDLTPTVMFSSHVDTVHSEAVGRQKIVYDPTFGHIFLDKDDPQCGSCLGADDGAGVWLMLEMIGQQVPGAYVFHRGEERGADGARAMLKLHAQWLKQFDIAIAFDRPGTDEVITHQGGNRCCSDKFATALAERLNTLDDTFQYKPSDRGVFTDTKIYRGVINECVNLGVGYSQQHGKDECLDYDHLVRLRDVLVVLNWDSLPVDRMPTDAPEYRGGGYGGYDYGYGRNNIYPYRARGTGGRFPGHFREDFDDFDFDLLGDRTPVPAANERPAPAPSPAAKEEVDETQLPTGVVKEPTLVEELENATPEEIEAALEELGENACFVVMELIAEIKGLQAQVAQLKSYMKR